MHIISITILKWNKYNPRPDRVNYSWFRFQNDFFHDQKMFGLSDAQIILYQFLLCEASKKNKDSFDVNVDYLSTIRKMSESKIINDIQELAKRDFIIAAECRQDAGTVPAKSHTTNIRTDIHTEQTDRQGVQLAPSSPPPLVSIWNGHCGEKLAKVLKTNKSRNAKSNALFKENSVDEWAEIVKRIANSKFCCGENDRGWKATFDWLLRPDTHLKVSEGKYDNNGEKKSEDREEFWKQFGKSK